MNPTDSLSRQTFRLALLSALWAPLGLAIALAVPCQAPSPDPLVGPCVPLLLTGGLLLALLTQGVRLVGHTGQSLVAIPCVVLGVVLFGVLFVQVGCHLGMGHYRWESLPRWHDWLALPAAHVLRTADLLDLIEIFHPPAQTIHPGSPLTRALVVALQLAFGLFFLRLLGEWGRAIWRVCYRPFHALPPGARQAFKIPGIFVAFAVVTLLLGAILVVCNDLLGRGSARLAELGWWFVEQLLRVADFPDAMTVYGVRLHRLPGFWWLTLASVFVRGLLFVLLFRVAGRLGRRISLLFLGGRGLSPGELDGTFHHDPDRRLRVLAGRRLFELNVADPPRRLGSWVALSVGLVLVTGVVAAVATADPERPGWDSAALRLANEAITADDDRSEVALASLSRMGPYAGPAVPVLGANLMTVPARRRQDILRTLGDLGPRALPWLEERLGDEGLAAVAAESLSRLGPVAVPVLTRRVTDGPEAVRQVARRALAAIGRPGLPGLLAVLDRGNAPNLVPVLEEIDPSWYANEAAAAAAEEVRAARLALALIVEPERVRRGEDYWLPDDAARAILQQDDPAQLASWLCDLGPVSEPAVPVLLRQLADEGTSYGRGRLLAGLGRLGPSAVPALRRQRAAAGPGERARIERVLDRVDPGWRGIR